MRWCDEEVDERWRAATSGEMIEPRRLVRERPRTVHWREVRRARAAARRMARELWSRDETSGWWFGGDGTGWRRDEVEGDSVVSVSLASYTVPVLQRKEVGPYSPFELDVDDGHELELNK